MSFSVGCGGCGLEYSGRRPFAQPRNAAEPALPRAPLGDRPLAADRAAARSTRPTTSAARSATTSTSAATRERFRRHFLVPLTVGALVDRAGARARVPGGVRDPLLRQPRHARLRPLPLAHGDRRQPTRTSARSRERLGARLRLGLGVRVGAARRRTASSCATDDGERAPLRRGRRRDARRPGARRCSRIRATTSGACSARFALHARTRPSCTPTRRFLPRARAARASWNYRLGDDGRADDHLLPEPAAARSRRTRLLRDAERATIADEHVIARFVYDHPLYTRRHARGAARAAGALRAARHTRFAGAHHGNGFHEDGLASGVRAAAALGVELVRSALYDGHADARAAHAGAERLPLPGLVLAARPRRAARARAAAARSFSVNRPQRRLASATPTTSTATAR